MKDYGKKNSRSSDKREKLLKLSKEEKFKKSNGRRKLSEEKRKNYCRRTSKNSTDSCPKELFNKLRIASIYLEIANKKTTGYGKAFKI